MLWDGGYIRYILFKGANLKIRLEILYLNNIFNIESKFKVLENKNIIDVVDLNNK